VAVAAAGEGQVEVAGRARQRARMAAVAVVVMKLVTMAAKPAGVPDRARQKVGVVATDGAKSVSQAAEVEPPRWQAEALPQVL